ncbi:rRNA maturation RNase YbeY [Phytohalomonas tamaricis]|uniref:rRNA maturation RNase YbeY n=1 Tax=Phytohalomonas tamaricis TaxID=2081032 RepID=UPI000D0B6D61|nr:rRNA maturation RNase YbeY [Phytohalomonas tamaricis]
MSAPVVDCQVAVDFAALPDEASLARWIGCVLDAHPEEARNEITVRFVDETESRELNRDYRGKDSSTNVLSFPFEAPPEVPIPLLGDLVISPHVVERESEDQQKALIDHFAHMVVHGTLHLLGYDHIEEDEAERMEQMERDLLATLGIADPYIDSSIEDERPHA